MSNQDHAGRKLYEARQAAGWTQARLAAGIGITHTHISGIESGRRKLTARHYAVQVDAERIGKAMAGFDALEDA